MTDLVALLRRGPPFATGTCQRAADEIERRNALSRDCAEHFKTLREANVFVWPNHPLNPELRIAEMLRGS